MAAAISMLPSQAPSIRAKLFRLPPASTTAMFISVPCSSAAARAASRTLCACARLRSWVESGARAGFAAATGALEGAAACSTLSFGAAL